MKNKIGEAKSYEEEYWWCDRCEIDDTGDRMCPCPRGYCEAEPIGKIIITKIYVPNKEEPERMVKTICPVIGLGADHAQRFCAVLLRPDCSRAHSPFSQALTPVGWQDFQRMDHGDVVVNGDKTGPRRVIGMTQEYPRFRPLGPVHDSQPLWPDTALRPDLVHDRQWTPDGKGGDPRDGRIGQVVDRALVDVDRVKNVIGTIRKLLIQPFVARSQAEYESLPHRAHRLFCSFDVSAGC